MTYELKPCCSLESTHVSEKNRSGTRIMFCFLRMLAIWWIQINPKKLLFTGWVALFPLISDGWLFTTWRVIRLPQYILTNVKADWYRLLQLTDLFNVVHWAVNFSIFTFFTGIKPHLPAVTAPSSIYFFWPHANIIRVIREDIENIKVVSPVGTTTQGDLSPGSWIGKQSLSTGNVFCKC